MYDQVGEVLDQRAALDTGAGAGIALSIALHAALTGAAVFVALRQPPPVTVNTLTIRLSPSAVTAVSTPAKQKREVAPLQEPRAAVEKPKTAPPPADAKKAAPPSPFGRSPKQAAEVAPPPPPAPALPAGAESAADIAVGSAGVTGLEGGDFPYTVYIENMKRLIGTHWFRPQAGGTATTTVYFEIGRDGAIRQARTETGSGASGFDRAALRAVLEASPLPPLPMMYNGTYLGVHLTFK